jgi:HK97 family phage portal protein
MITTLRGGQQIELFSFALTDMIKWGYQGLRSQQGGGESAVRGIPAIHRAARMRAEALASLRLRCWRGDGPDRERVDNVWQARLFRDAPNEYQTRFGFWETVGESLAYRNNAYIWKNIDPDTMRVVEMFALHPDQVACKKGRYEVKTMEGFVDPVGRGPGVYVVDESTIIHIRGHGQGGMYEAPSPIQVFKEALQAPIGRMRHENRMWRRGTALQVAIEFEKGVTPQQADEWKDSWRAAYEGVDGETTAVIGGGGTIRPIGLSTVDAALVELAKLSVHDAARIMGVPANLLGAQLDRSVPNLEQDLTTWFRFGLGPELERVESALSADDDLFGNMVPNRASVYPAFDSQAFVRGDVLTEDQIAHARVQDGRLLVDEWRQENGLPPLPGGAGKIPQIVPVGGGGNPNPSIPKVPAINGSQADG